MPQAIKEAPEHSGAFFISSRLRQERQRNLGAGDTKSRQEAGQVRRGLAKQRHGGVRIGPPDKGQQLDQAGARVRCAKDIPMRMESSGLGVDRLNKQLGIPGGQENLRLKTLVLPRNRERDGSHAVLGIPRHGGKVRQVTRLVDDGGWRFHPCCTPSSIMRVISVPKSRPAACIMLG